MADPNNKAPNEDEEADYSGYFKKDAPAAETETPQAPVSPLQEIPVTKKFTKRAMYLLIFLIILVAIQIVLMVTWKKNTIKPGIPDGYRLVTPPNQPEYIEKIK